MILKDIISKTYFGSISFIENNSSVDHLCSYLLYNKPVIDEYKGRLFAFTYKDLDKSYVESKIKSLFPDAIFLYVDVNRGHNFGTTDLDNTLFDYCKENNIPWLCRVSGDVILQSSLLDTPIESSDFYYMNGIGYGGLQSYDFDFDRVINENFFPQTNFYFINVSKTDYLYDKDFLDETYQIMLDIPNYNGRLWEYIQGWECERFLAACVQRNNLSKFHLLDNETYLRLLSAVKNYNIHDPSHKNLLINGVCHYQFPDQPAVTI